MPFATVGDVKINYTVQGEGDWLVLVGGYASGNWQAWGAQLAAFAKHFKVLAFDNRGIGESDVPDYPYTTLMMARDTLGLMDQLGIERAHVFGKSLGGNIGQWMALEQPKRLRSLVMTSTFAKPNARRAAMVRWWMATAVGAGYDKLFPGLMTYFYTPPNTRPNPCVRPAFPSNWWRSARHRGSAPAGRGGAPAWAPAPRRTSGRA